MKKVTFITLLIAFLSVFTFGQELEQHFKKVDIVKLDKKDVLKKVNERKLIKIGKYDLILELNKIRSSDYRSVATTQNGIVELEKGVITTYKGTIPGSEGSYVRLSIDDTIEGYIAVGGERFYIESAKQYKETASSDEFVLYKHEDMKHLEKFTCALHDNLTNELEKRSQDQSSVDFASSFSQSKVLEVATDADLEYTTRYGGVIATNNKILGIMNQVDGIYQNQLGIEILVVFQNAWEIEDPYIHNPAVENSFFNSLKSYWNNNLNFQAVHRDVVHLFALGTPFIGEAAESVACNRSEAYSYTRDYGSSHHRATAHELGHNVGASHTYGPEDRPPVEQIAGCEGTLMQGYGYLITSDIFCTDSRTKIANYTNSVSCLSPPPSLEPKQSFDSNGDGRADLAVFRPASGTFYTEQNPSVGFTSTEFINKTPAPADYDGDGISDPATYNSSNGRFDIKFSNFSYVDTYIMLPSNAITVSADYDGGGRAEVAVFSNGVWTMYNYGTSQFSTEYYGQSGDVPAQADYDADGKTDLAVFRPSEGRFYIKRSRLGVTTVVFGQSGDIPVSADYDGDNSAEVAIYRNGTWVTHNIRTQQVNYIYHGSANQKPIVGDYDGDGKADATVFYEYAGAGFFYTLYSQYGYAGGATFGNTTDKPLGFRNPQ